MRANNLPVAVLFGSWLLVANLMSCTRSVGGGVDLSNGSRYQLTYEGTTVTADGTPADLGRCGAPNWPEITRGSLIIGPAADKSKVSITFVETGCTVIATLNGKTSVTAEAAECDLDPNGGLVKFLGFQASGFQTLSIVLDEERIVLAGSHRWLRQDGTMLMGCFAFEGRTVSGVILSLAANTRPGDR